jgi:hypothetical protein
MEGAEEVAVLSSGIRREVLEFSLLTNTLLVLPSNKVPMFSERADGISVGNTRRSAAGIVEGTEAMLSVRMKLPGWNEGGVCRCLDGVS